MKEKIMNFETAETVGQWIPAIIGGVGIGIVITVGAKIGFVIITAGALLFALFTKIKYFRY